MKRVKQITFLKEHAVRKNKYRETKFKWTQNNENMLMRWMILLCWMVGKAGSSYPGDFESSSHTLDIIYHCFRDEMKRIHAVSKSSSPCSLSFVLSFSSHIPLPFLFPYSSQENSFQAHITLTFEKYSSTSSLISVTVSRVGKCRMVKRKNELK